MEETLTVVKRENDLLARTRSEQADTISTLQTQVKDLQERLSEARNELSIIPELRKEILLKNQLQKVCGGGGGCLG